MKFPRSSRASLSRARFIASFIALAAACSGEHRSLTTGIPADSTGPGVDSARSPRRGFVRPNIVFLLADDMRWDALHVTGNTVVQTPNLDGLAANGVVFRNAYVTSPICAISRASIFTGEYARRHAINDFVTELSPSAIAESYPALLRAAGYRTGFIGKYGVGERMPTALFDYWKGFAGQGSYETRDSAGHATHLTPLMADQAVAFLESQPRDKPFVLSMSFKAPHVQDGDPRNFIPEARDRGMYDGMAMPKSPAADDRYWNAFPAFFRASNEGRIRWQALFSTPRLYDESLRNYFRLVTGMDRAIGEVRAALERLGFAQNTIIVFTSDNGFHFGELGLAHKWYGFDPSVRVPLIVYDPRDNQQGRYETRIALNIDLAPTMLAMAGVRTPVHMQGKSLLPLLADQSGTEWRDDFLFEHLMTAVPTIRRSSGVIGGRFKYLRYLDPLPYYESLYDMSADPNELTDLARHPAYQATLAELRARHDQLVTEAR
jgi:arylsulfatase A-like enzyme